MPPHTHPKTLQNLIITFLFFLAGKQLSSQWIQVSRVICNMPKSILCSVSPDGPRAAWCNKRTEGVHWLNCWAVEKKEKKKQRGQITVEVPPLSTRATTRLSDASFEKIPRQRILANVSLLQDVIETRIFQTLSFLRMIRVYECGEIHSQCRWQFS